MNQKSVKAFLVYLLLNRNQFSFGDFFFPLVVKILWWWLLNRSRWGLRPPLWCKFPKLNYPELSINRVDNGLSFARRITTFLLADEFRWLTCQFVPPKRLVICRLQRCFRSRRFTCKPPVGEQCLALLAFPARIASWSVIKRWVLSISLMHRELTLVRFSPSLGSPKLSPGPDGGSGECTAHQCPEESMGRPALHEGFIYGEVIFTAQRFNSGTAISLSRSFLILGQLADVFCNWWTWWIFRCDHLGLAL